MPSTKKPHPTKGRAPTKATGKGAKPPARSQGTQAKKKPTPAKAATTGTNKGGRPPIFTPKLATAFCELLMEGATLREACAGKGMPSVKTVMRWLHDDTGGFRQQYARAREVQAELDVDDQVAIARTPQRYATVEFERVKGKKTQVPVLVALDPAEVANRRLQADALRWRAGKMAPKKYGSLLDNANGAGGIPLVLVNDFSGRKQQAPEPGQEGAPA